MVAALKQWLVDAPAATAAVPAQSRSLLRFITCGSVDDGKSTLLGRLLYETGAVFDDQLDALARDSSKFGTTGKALDFALLVDGLAAEREQGITIDVAYRYFSTPRRAFIAADTPGHEQYTRNMATGASTADVAIILVDARKGLLAQTRRHSYIVSMLGVRKVIVAVNKMDLVGHDEETFRTIETAYRGLIPQLGFGEVHVVPLSARDGDNISTSSLKMAWYRGPSLLGLLETIEVGQASDGDLLFPVQWVNRPSLDFRGFAGTLARGTVLPGDAVRILPRGTSSRIARIVTADGDRDEASGGEAVTLTLTDEIDVSRGDVIVPAAARISASRALTVRLLAVSEAAITPGRRYLMKLGTATVFARVSALHHAIDVHDYVARPAEALAMNAIGLVSLSLEAPVVATPYGANQTLGSLLLIDPASNDTLAMGVVEKVVQPEAETAPETAWAKAVARLRHGLVDAGLIAGDASTADALRYASWRAFSAALVALVVLVAGGGIVLSVVAGILDLFVRPLMRVVHDRVWARIAAARRIRAEEQLSLDGGGI